MTKQKKKIMVIDDDTATLELTADRLRRAGFEVSTRSHAIGTSSAVMTQLPEIILLDIAMPGLSGPQLVSILNRHPSTAKIPVIFHSGKSLVELQQMAQEAQVFGVIPKTDKEEIFLGHLHRLLKRQESGSGEAQKAEETIPWPEPPKDDTPES